MTKVYSTDEYILEEMKKIYGEDLEKLSGIGSLQKKVLLHLYENERDSNIRIAKNRLENKIRTLADIVNIIKAVHPEMWDIFLHRFESMQNTNQVQQVIHEKVIKCNSCNQNLYPVYFDSNVQFEVIPNKFWCNKCKNFYEIENQSNKNNEE